MKTYYLQNTSNVWHEGREGNTYRLNSFEKLLALYEAIESDRDYDIEVISSKNIKDESLDAITSTHNENFIQAYKTGTPKEIAEGSGVKWQPSLYDYTIEEAEATLRATDYAISNQTTTLVLTGGGHHCEKNQPFGFCTVNTMAISSLRSVNKWGHKTALIDLDTHFSNGCFSILKGNEQVLCTSLWNQKLDKWSEFASEGNIFHQHVENVSDYMTKLDEFLLQVENWQPQFMVYHLGMDVLETDRMGGVLGMTDQKFLEREEKTSKVLRKLGIPYIIFLGGAYTDHSKGEVYALEHRKQLTGLCLKALKLHNPAP